MARNEALESSTLDNALDKDGGKYFNRKTLNVVTKWPHNTIIKEL